MIYVIFFAAFVYMLSTISRFNTGTSDITELIRKTHVYSGIDEKSYSQFYANIQLAVEHKSEMFMHKAIDHLNDIPLYMSPIDPDVQVEVAKLGQEIAVAFERVLMKESMNTNTYYRPKYI